MTAGVPRDVVRSDYAKARDTYILVFILILSAILLTAVMAGPGTGGILVTVVQTAALLLTLRTAGVSGRALHVMRALAVLPVLAAVLALLLQRAVGPVYYASIILLVLGTQAAIAAHAIRRMTVTLDTVMGALCIYLLVGLLFANLDAFYASLGAPFFAQAGPHDAVDYMYFSFVTLTTTGFGDLTPASPVARVLAMSEALLGQLYLVTVIALLVGNLGARARVRRRDAPDEG